MEQDNENNETKEQETAAAEETQRNTDMTQNLKPHGPRRLHLLLFVAGLLLILSAAAWLLTSNNDTEDESAENIQTTESVEVVTQNSDVVSSGTSYLEGYTISDSESGTVVTVTIDETNGTRTIERNALPNHETGEFPTDGNPNTISAQDFTEVYPLDPTFTGTAQFARTVGIAINGVKFEPDTAERAVCEGGVQHSIEAIQDVTNLGLDFNNAHVQPTGEYHYHGVSELLVNLYDNGRDIVHVGFAADGHNIYYSKSNAYSPSYKIGTDDREGSGCTYTVPGQSGGDVIEFSSTKDGSLKSDWDFDQSYGILDECNGTTIAGEYRYFITNSYPYIGRCLMGEFSEEQPGGEAPGSTGTGQGTPSGPPPGGGPPSN